MFRRQTYKKKKLIKYANIFLTVTYDIKTYQAIGHLYRKSLSEFSILGVDGPEGLARLVDLYLQLTTSYCYHDSRKISKQMNYIKRKLH